MNKCQSCGAENAPNMKYCLRCGAALAAETPDYKFCLKCGAERDPAMKFCMKCGTAFNAPAAAPNPQPKPKAGNRKKIILGGGIAAALVVIAVIIVAAVNGGGGGSNYTPPRNDVYMNSSTSRSPSPVSASPSASPKNTYSPTPAPTQQALTTTPAPTPVGLTYSDAFALALSRGFDEARYEHDHDFIKPLDGLLKSPYLTNAEKAEVLGIMIADPSSEISALDEKAQLEYEKLYTFFSYHADKTNEVEYAGLSDAVLPPLSAAYADGSMLGVDRAIYELYRDYAGVYDWGRAELFMDTLDCAYHLGTRNTIEEKTGISGTTPQQPASASPSPSAVSVKYTEADLKTAMAIAKKAEDNGLTAYANAYKTTSFPWNSVSGSTPVGLFEGYWVQGSMKNGVPDGVCFLIRSKGEKNTYDSYDFTDIIAGTFKNGKLNGFGHVQNSSIEYFGYFTDNKFDGLGLYIDPQKNEWWGDWKNGSFTGYGRVVIRGTGSAVYCGYFDNGVLQGKGSMQVNKDTWFGDFKDGQLIMPLGFDEYTSEERARDAAALTNALAGINKMYSDYNKSTADIYSSTEESIAKFTEGLIKSNPPPTFHYVPTDGTGYWNYTAGY